MENTPTSGSTRQAKAFKIRLRFDYRGEKNGGLFNRKPSDKVAEEQREQVASLLRNVPRRGVYIEEIDTNLEIYKIIDEETGNETAFAPLEMIAYADSIEDIIGFVMRPEFRRVEILHPKDVSLTDKGIERLLYKVNEELGRFSQALEKKLNSR